MSLQLSEVGYIGVKGSKFTCSMDLYFVGYLTFVGCELPAACTDTSKDFEEYDNVRVFTGT